jgi:hypothetical protein
MSLSDFIAANPDLEPEIAKLSAKDKAILADAFDGNLSGDERRVVAAAFDGHLIRQMGIGSGALIQKIRDVVKKFGPEILDDTPALLKALQAMGVPIPPGVPEIITVFAKLVKGEMNQKK